MIGRANRLLDMYSSTFSTTISLDLWVDQEFASMAITSRSFPAFLTFHSFTNVTTLNLLYQSPLYLLPLFQHWSGGEDCWTNRPTVFLTRPSTIQVRTCIFQSDSNCRRFIKTCKFTILVGFYHISSQAI